MRDGVSQKIILTGLILFLLVMASGCETMSAMKSGEIRMDDFVQMAKANLPGPRARSRPAEKQNVRALDFSGLDSWFRDNLW